MSNKVSKRVKLYISNPENQVAEVDLVQRAAQLTHLSMEDYLRGAILTYSAGVIQREVSRITELAKEREKSNQMNSTPTKQTGDVTNETTKETVNTETTVAAEAGETIAASASTEN